MYAPIAMCRTDESLWRGPKLEMLANVKSLDLDRLELLNMKML